MVYDIIYDTPITWQYLQMYKQQIYKKVNRFSQQGNLCLEYWHISMSTSFTNRATKISALNIERASRLSKLDFFIN